MSDKPINWVGSSREDLRSFPAFARKKAGFQLRAVQKGQVPSNSDPMPTIGKGVKEIRIRANGAYRVFGMVQIRVTKQNDVGCLK